MQKFILKTSLFLISLSGFSQSYSDVSYNSATSGAWDGISADCTIGIKITTSQGGIYCDHHLQSFNLKTLRIAQKDIPASQVPSNVILDKRVDVTFDLYVNNVFIERHGQPSVSWAKLQGLPNSDSYKPATSENGYKLFNSGAITIRNVKISKLHYRVDETYHAQIRNEIAGKNNKNTTGNPVKQGNSTSLTIENNSSNNNSVTQTGTTNSGMPADTSGNDPLTHFNNPQPTSTNSNIKAVGQFVDAVSPMLEQWADNIQKRRDAEQRLYEENEKKEKEERIKYARERFLSAKYLEKYMDKAKRGDETAQMTLYYASLELFSTGLVPQRVNWFNKALANNNLDALLESSNVSDPQKLYDDPHTIMVIVERAANLGSVDAMLILGEYYDKKTVVYKTINQKGGGNSAKAIEWLTKAAEKGSPNAMFYLGHIYKYGSTPRTDSGYGFMKKLHNDYTALIDEKKAFEWFSKSLLPNYEGSLFNKYHIYDGSRFNSNTYVELAYFYRKGKIVEKDVEKAKILEKIYKNIRTDYKAFSF